MRYARNTINTTLTSTGNPTTSLGTMPLLVYTAPLKPTLMLRFRFLTVFRFLHGFWVYGFWFFRDFVMFSSDFLCVSPCLFDEKRKDNVEEIRERWLGLFFFLEFSVISLVQLLVFLSVWLLKKLEEESLNICLVLLFLFSYSIAKKVIEMGILRLRK